MILPNRDACKDFCERWLMNLLPIRRLTREQERLDELAFAAEDKSGESPEPVPFRNIRLSIEPTRKQHNLIFGNASLAHAQKQVSEKPRRYALTADFRHAVRDRRSRA